MENKEEYEEQFCSSCEIICPFCKNKEQYTGDALGDDEATEEICSKCGKKFVVRASVTMDHYCCSDEETK